jgi:hypothetical protein
MRHHLNLIILILASSLFSALGNHGAFAQVPSTSSGKPDTSARSAITATYAFGEVVDINLTKREVLIKTKEGNLNASFDDRTQFKIVPPGAESLDQAQPITLADVSVGDILMARGKVSEDRKTVLARQMIVMNKKAIEEKQNRDRERWRTNSLAGRVTAINPQTREVALVLRTSAGERPVLIEIPARVTLRRYAPDSIRFTDALPSPFQELKVGDQLRALGQKSQDGTHFVAEEVVSGSFRILGGPILGVNPAKEEITINDVTTKKPVTVLINANSTLRNVPAELVASLAQKTAPGNGTAPSVPGNNPGNNARPQAKSTDLLEIFDRLPPVTINDLKPGRMVLVSSTNGSDSSRVTAILLATGLDVLFSRPQAAGQRKIVGAVGLPGGVFDGFIGTP